MKVYKNLMLIAVSVFWCSAACDQTQPVWESNTADYTYQPIGANAANLFLYYPEVSENSNQLIEHLSKSGISILRFPGGTTANFYHPKEPGYGFRSSDLDVLKTSPVKQHMEKTMMAEAGIIRKNGLETNFIYPLSKLVAKHEIPVMYVANLLTGTVEETLFAIKELEANEVTIFGVELGNEYYLKAYADKFPSVDAYLSKAKTFAAAIKQQFPDIQLSVVGAPSSEIKPLSSREKNWNSALSKATFYKAISVHCYPYGERKSAKDIAPCGSIEALEMGHRQLSAALKDYDRQFGTKDIWISEWNILGAPKWCSNSWSHACFTTAALASFSGHKSVKCHIYHSLLSRGEGYNLIKKGQTDELSATFNAHAFQLNKLLQNHLGKESGSLTQEIQQLENGAVDITYTLKDGKRMAQIVLNPTSSALETPRHQSQLQNVYLITEDGFSIKSISGSTQLAPKCIALFLYSK